MNTESGIMFTALWGTGVILLCLTGISSAILVFLITSCFIGAGFVLGRAWQKDHYQQGKRKPTNV